MRHKNTKTNDTNGTQPEILHLSHVNQRDVTVSFDDSTLSTCGGLAMLKEVERDCGIIGEIASVMQDRRKHWLVQHPLEEMLRQRVTQIACGYEKSIANNRENAPKTAPQAVFSFLKHRTFTLYYSSTPSLPGYS